MNDRMVFTEVAALRADTSRPVVSVAALEVHVRAVCHLAHTTRAQFLDDASLDEIASGYVTTMAAIELCLAGWWRRLDGGYLIVDQELIDALAQPQARRRLGAAVRRLWTALNSERFIPL
ncbi:MAG: hypothetical protein ABW137_29240 [Mycobacterium sp.]